jgi:hypothetical protein
MTLKQIGLWSLIGITFIGWLITPGIGFQLRLGLVQCAVQISNPIPLLVELWRFLNPVQLSKVDEEIAALDERTKSSWPKDGVAQTRPWI